MCWYHESNSGNGGIQFGKNVNAYFLSTTFSYISMSYHITIKQNVQHGKRFWRNMFRETLYDIWRPKTNAALLLQWVDACHNLILGLYSLSGKTSYRKISRSLEAARFGFKLFQSLWSLAGTSAALLPRCLSNFRAIRPLQHPISRLRDFTIFGGKTSYRLVNRGPVFMFGPLDLYERTSLEIEWNLYQDSHTRECIWKYRLHDARFVRASTS